MEPPMTDTPPRPRLAFHHTPGAGPTIMFLPGYASDMNGTKALALEAWAKAQGRAFLRFDYGGCGESEGAFEKALFRELGVLNRSRLHRFHRRRLPAHACLLASRERAL